MPSVANTVVVQNCATRAYFIGDVQVLAGEWGRVDGDHPFLIELASRGKFRIFDDVPQPVVETQQTEPEPAPSSSKKLTAKTSNKGDE